jgi:glycosyltransferase involved in cell wall biosynthesis
MDASRRPRLLMLAYACRPNEGSEPGMGWNRAVAAAREFDTWVICEGTRCESAIRSYLAEHGDVPNLNFAFVRRTALQQRLARIPGMFYPAYNLWQRAAFETAQRLHAEVQFDLVHQVTYCGYREPGYAWQLPAPFVWGPIGGTHNYPWRYLPQAGPWGALVEGIRSLANTLQFRLSPRVGKVARRAALALAGNSTTQRHFRETYDVDMPLHPASGIADFVPQPRTPRSDPTLHLLWCGYLHPLKGLPILFDALTQLPRDFPYRLRVVGKGPFGKRWQRLAERLGIAQHIEWTGWITHAEALEQYRWADLFLFTSLRDTFPTVVLEALAAGTPVVCIDHLGMADIVTPECGRKVPLASPREVACGFRDAIVAIARDPHSWQRMSERGMERAQSFTWSAQANVLANHYRRILAGEPEFTGCAAGETSSSFAGAACAGAPAD